MKAMLPTGWYKRIRPPHLSMHLPDQEADHSIPICSMLRPCRRTIHGCINTPRLKQIFGQRRPHLQISSKISLDRAHLDPRRTWTTSVRRDSLFKVQQVCQQALVLYMLRIVHAESGIENIHGASSQAFRYGHGTDSANASLVSQRSQGDLHHPVKFPLSHPSYHDNARDSSSPGTILSTNEYLQEPLGPRSIQSINANKAAMEQDLGQMFTSSQSRGDYTGGHLLATDGFSWSQAFESVSENDRSMPVSGLLLAEGYGHRDPQVPFQEAHPEPVSQGPAPGEAGARKRAQAPRSVAGSASNSKGTRGKRNGPLTAKQRAHQNRVRKAGRKDCVHKRGKSRVIPR